jgi:hypothetical protein
MSRKEKLEMVVQSHQHDRVWEERNANSRKFRLEELVAWDLPYSNSQHRD